MQPQEKAEYIAIKKQRFVELTGLNALSKEVKQYFKKRSNLAFYNALTAEHHGSSSQFWNKVVSRVEAEQRLVTMGYDISKLAPNHQKFLNLLLDIGFESKGSNSAHFGLLNFPSLLYSKSGQTIEIRFLREDSRGVNLEFNNGAHKKKKSKTNKSTGFSEYLSAEPESLLGVYRLAKFLIEYVIPCKIALDRADAANLVAIKC